MKSWNWKKIWLRIGLGTVILLLAVVLFVFIYVQRTLPDTNGEIFLEALSSEVSVTRNEEGVPHIEADSLEDLYMAQGYVQAQDRLLQMELSRRQASGELSEIIGSATIDQDKFFRSLGLRRAAEASLEDYSQEGRAALEAFAEGVNTYIEKADRENSLPPAFTLLGSKPEPWTPVDSLTIGKFMAHDLGGHWERQAFQYYAMNNFTEEKAEEIMAYYPENKPKVLEDTSLDIAGDFRNASLPHPFNGSNNWVVSGERTESGNPVLADDPHLGIATPSIWYQMKLSGPDHAVSGVIFAGVPGIILGHNEDVAWGVTNVGPDVQQLYVERRNPENPEQFLYEGEWEDAVIHEEPIEVSGGETIDYEVVETRNGPIINEFSEGAGEGEALSLRWTAHDPSRELEAVLDINRADDWESFEKGLEKFHTPAQNFVFASNDGTIAYKANGKIPIYDNPADSQLPLRGWVEEDQWDGFIPFNELPKVVNPEKGWVATANNKITTDDYPYHISHNWAQPYRYERIQEMLEEDSTITVEDVKRMQMDVKNLQAEEFTSFLVEEVKREGLSDGEIAALSLMEEWNFEDNKELSQPLIFHHWLDQIENLLYADIPEDINSLFHRKAQTTDEILRAEQNGEESEWMKEAGGKEKVITSAFRRTYKKLEMEYGASASDWAWGDFHRVEFTHPLSDIAFLDRFYNRKDPLPVSGSRVTVRAAGFDDNGKVDHGASWRYVIDTSDMTKSHHIVGPGQSERFNSKWYHSQYEDWVEGDYHETNLLEDTGEELLLLPEE
ncbi:penicillin acylase family protein [Salimicrobium halophilum]|uniref:Penicillin amidase n=1 Tax=Salimicrobium halophilum TaxID=86666 RepID=A0A1G8RM18_9BACI|nr:penicillin acylase family protein [Salimicrobium halophilum]SDJ17943.1 penicillin amidase [Salimicrobium halophilum]